MPSTDPIQHPTLVDALVQLADALDRRSVSATGGLSPLAMAVVADQIAEQVHELAHSLVGLARAEGRASWADIGHAFGVTRQAALRRWRTAPGETRS